MPRSEIRGRPRGLTRDAISLACGREGGGVGDGGVRSWGCEGDFEGKATAWAGNVGQYIFF